MIMDIQKQRGGTVPYSNATEYDAMSGIFA
jgi:hypothetical protein